MEISTFALFVCLALATASLELDLCNMPRIEPQAKPKSDFVCKKRSNGQIILSDDSCVQFVVSLPISAVSNEQATNHHQPHHTALEQINQGNDVQCAGGGYLKCNL